MNVAELVGGEAVATSQGGCSNDSQREIERESIPAMNERAHGVATLKAKKDISERGQLECRMAAQK